MTTTRRTRAPRIGTLTPGHQVRLGFANRGGTYVETHTFLGYSLDADGSARARFERSEDPGQAPVQWEAYRYQGRWAYGSGAQALTLVAVLGPADV